jgi:hypothetical protein
MKSEEQDQLGSEGSRLQKIALNLEDSTESVDPEFNSFCLSFHYLILQEVDILVDS